MPWSFDYLIVGAGFSGLVLAERLSNELGASCLVVDRRAHIGGNCYDEHDDHGVLVHRYGPHYFRTNSSAVLDYLSGFTDWRKVTYRVLSHTEGRYWSFPINLKTFEQLVGRVSTDEEFETYLAQSRLRIPEPRNSEEVVLAQVGPELFQRFFAGYTRKQWGLEPRQLDPSVCARIPVRTNRDDAYLTERFQALPAQGYTRLFERMLSRSPRVKVLLKTDYRELRSQIQCGHLIFTGPIDEYFDHCYGALPYRSLRFEAESFGPAELESRVAISGKRGFWQPALQVNYPNDEAFTRIVELKHATGQICENTTIIREYPEPHGPGNDPYYPVPSASSRALYARYEARARAERAVTFVGRLGTYRYLNMDQVVAAALVEFERLKTRLAA
ncbi:MAG TPA: UDP-galactopyranose mutase [Opitutaceae bacterium]|nr:UDP-galactopyranose mutase [Opitutaceae bacterium]